MTTSNTGQHITPSRHPRPAGTVDFTFTYAAHDAFNRDLRRLAAAVEAGRTADPAVRAGWATFKTQLHVHHTAEDRWLWPALRDKVTRPDEVSVLDAMEAEHLRIDPLLARVDASLTATGLAGLADNASALASALTAHMQHEEDHALPLVEAHLGAEGWAAFGKAAGKSQGLRGAAELFPWMLDGAPADTSKRLLGMLPPPARLLYRALWHPGYARTPRWGTAAIWTPRKANTMKLTILGATGATGTSLTEQALAAGHEVTAVVRDPARLEVPAHRRLRAITADVMDPASITQAIAGADAVISAVGPRGTGPTTVIHDSVHSILQAMQKTGTRRLLQVSGSVVADDGESPYLRYLLKPVARRTFLRHVCADMRRGEDEIRHSNLDWTIFRPPALTSKPARGTYRTAIDRNLPHGFTISRADLAACMLTLLDDPATVCRHISIAN